MSRADIVIVGGGLAGAATAEQYRKAGGTDSIAILSADSDLPVHRPPLSKEFLRGDAGLDVVFIHGRDFFEQQNIDLKLDTVVSSIDLGSKELRQKGGEAFGFGRLVLATGARPRLLSVPGSDQPGVHYLRSLSSSRRLAEQAANAQRAVVIGAGFIGIEVAATLTQRGVSCTVVEMADRMWSRLTPPETSHAIQRACEARGIQFRFGVSVREMSGSKRAKAVVLNTGEKLPADLVVGGVGAELNTQLAEAAGLKVDRGVLVGRFFDTEADGVYAVGDIARFPDPVGGSLHLEHWDHALSSGQALGNTLAGEATPYEHVACFFSDIFDLSLNMIGYPESWDRIIQRGDLGGEKFTTLYLRDGILRAALMINDDGHFDDWTRLIRGHAHVSEGTADMLSHPNVDPSEILVERHAPVQHA
jgi:3-phenylpropionate/trans-cinnamate dioxygenase ferredoxin reductase subunit